MPTWLRRSLYSSLGLLWLSGIVWLILHWFFARKTEFGTAVAATFLFGWIAGSHVGFNWRRGLQRVSGVTLIVLLAVLALTGLGNYYLTWDAARTVNSLVHQGAGLLAIVPALVHWAVAKRTDSSSVGGR
jgi:Na+/H+ antiporter NhaC